MKLRYTPQAIADLDEIATYISENLQNPAAAHRIVETIARDAAKLKDYPELGGLLSEKLGREVDGRFLISGRYILIYEVDEAVSILRVIDSRLDYMRMIGTW